MTEPDWKARALEASKMLDRCADRLESVGHDLDAGGLLELAGTCRRRAAEARSAARAALSDSPADE
jgi:hypothetical protein